MSLDVQLVVRIPGVERIGLAVVKIFYIYIALRSVSDRRVVSRGRAVVIEFDLLDAAGEAGHFINSFRGGRCGIRDGIQGQRAGAKRQIDALQSVRARVRFRANENVKARARHLRSVQRNFARRVDSVGRRIVIRQIEHLFNDGIARQIAELAFERIRSAVIPDDQAKRLVGIRRYRMRQFERNQLVRRSHAVHPGNFGLGGRRDRRRSRVIDVVGGIARKRRRVVRHDHLERQRRILRAVRQRRRIVVQQRIFGSPGYILFQVYLRERLVGVEKVDHPRNVNGVGSVRNFERDRIFARDEIERRRIERAVGHERRNDRRPAVQRVGHAGRIFDGSLNGYVLAVHDDLRAFVQHDRARGAAHYFNAFHVRDAVIEHVERIGTFDVALHAGKRDLVEAGEKRKVARRKPVGRARIRRYGARHGMRRIRRVIRPGGRNGRVGFGCQHFDLDGHARRGYV